MTEGIAGVPSFSSAKSACTIVTNNTTTNHTGVETMAFFETLMIKRTISVEMIITLLF